MKKVYVITYTTEVNKNMGFSISDVLYAFSSEKKANKQLDIIMKLVIEGKWWSDKLGRPLHGKILSEQYCTNRHGYNMRYVMIKSPNGLTEIYKISRLDLNSGFCMDF